MLNGLPMDTRLIFYGVSMGVQWVSIDVRWVFDGLTMDVRWMFDECLNNTRFRRDKYNKGRPWWEGGSDPHAHRVD